MISLLVTMRTEIEAATGERRDAIDSRWSEFLFSCRIRPVYVPNNPAVLRLYLARGLVNGVLLTGGGAIASMSGAIDKREHVENALISWCRTTGTPLLGVCRGFQKIATMFGAQLAPVNGHVGTEHCIDVDGDVRRVNSFHNYQITHLPPALQIRANASDGCLEWAEHFEEPVAGIMWHPERSAPFDPRDTALFRRWFFTNGHK